MERLTKRFETMYVRIDQRLGGVLSLLMRVVSAFNRDDGPLLARSIAYYALFAIFPALLALIVIISQIMDLDEVQTAVLGFVGQHFPLALGVVGNNIEQLLETQETVGVIALVGLVWSASGVFGALFRAVNRAWGVPKTQLVLSEKAYGFLMLSVVGVFFLMNLFVRPLLDIARTERVPLLGWRFFDRQLTVWLVRALSILVSSLISVGAFTLMYRTMPRARIGWCDVWLGGLGAGLVWETGNEIFIWYVGNIAAHNLIYGSVGTIIVFLLWCYLGAQIVLLGAEFTAQHTQWRQAGRPLEAPPLDEWIAGLWPARQSQGGEQDTRDS